VIITCRSPTPRLVHREVEAGVADGEREGHFHLLGGRLGRPDRLDLADDVRFSRVMRQTGQAASDRE
jgi:hypothetical protein